MTSAVNDSLYNFSNTDFGVSPRNTYVEPFNVRFYLKHFRWSTVQYMLNQTGWDTITQFEDRARRYDMSTCSISPNGFLISTMPEVDANCFRVFELSLHHLHSDVLERFMKYYIGMNLTDYELQYPEFNNIYVAMPYSSWIINEYTSVVATQLSTYEPTNCAWACDCAACPDMNQQPDESESDSDTEFSVELPTYSTSQQTGSLKGWYFKLNSKTKNSYVLKPNSDIHKVSHGLVYWGKSQTPTTWNLKLKGLERPVYYSDDYNGWILSLKLKQSLLSAGATEK